MTNRKARVAGGPILQRTVVSQATVLFSLYVTQEECQYPEITNKRLLHSIPRFIARLVQWTEISASLGRRNES
jgi:hypothetical protein